MYATPQKTHSARTREQYEALKIEAPARIRGHTLTMAATRDEFHVGSSRFLLVGASLLRPVPIFYCESMRAASELQTGYSRGARNRTRLWRGRQLALIRCPVRKLK